MKVAIADIPKDTKVFDSVTDNPRAVKYGFLPIWPYPTSSRQFYVWVIPANVVFPFRPFVSEILQDINGNTLSVFERLPGDQITDMQTSCPEFIYLSELSEFEKKGATEEDIYQVVSALTNKKKCSKYPIELNNECISCWVEYLNNVFYEKADSLPFSNPESVFVAKSTAAKLVNGMSSALESARRRINKALMDIDDPRSGKDSFTDNDMLAVYHTHSDRPKYKTVVSDTGSMSPELLEILKAIKDSYGQNAETQRILIQKFLEKFDNGEEIKQETKPKKKET